MSTRMRISLVLILTGMLISAAPRFASAQKHDGPPGDGNRAHRAGGRITAISGATISVDHHDGSTDTIVVSDATTFLFNRQPASFPDLTIGDFVMAIGERDAGGQLLARRINGSDQPPPPPHHPGMPPPDDANHVGGKVVSVDTNAGTLTLARRDGETLVVQTNAETKIARNRQEATLADFKPGDHAMAHGERNENGQFVADHLAGGDRKPEHER